MKKEKGYIAGNLFSDAMIRQRLFEEEKLKEVLPNVEWYNPISAPCNNKAKLPTAEDIFWGDTYEVLPSKYIIADLSDPTDTGTACELAIAFMCNYLNDLFDEGYTIEELRKVLPRKKVYAHLSDIRMATANKYDGINVPVGFNQYMIGMIQDMNKVYSHFEDIIEDLKDE